MDPLEITSLLLPLGLFCLALTVRALFSFLETSVTSLRLFKLKELSQAFPSYQSLLSSLEKEPQRILISILVANSLIDALTTALALKIMHILFSYFKLSGQLGFSIGIALSTVAILIFGEIIPKSIAKTQGDRLFFSSLWLANLLFHFLHPLITALIAMSNSVSTRYTLANQKNVWDISEHEVRFLINHIHSKGLIETQKNELLQNIFELGTTPVRTIMIPRSKMQYILTETSLEKALTIFSQCNFSRLPACKGTIDTIVGTIHLKDLIHSFFKDKRISLQQLVRPIIFVIEDTKVNQLLTEFQNQQVQIAVITTNSGSMLGLTTLKDVLKEIVGEINDEDGENSITHKRLHILMRTTKESSPHA